MLSLAEDFRVSKSIEQEAPHDDINFTSIRQSIKKMNYQLRTNVLPETQTKYVDFTLDPVSGTVGIY